MKGYISEGIDKYLAGNCERFHTPGHKGTLLNRDITELGAHCEIFPADCIEKAQRRTAQIYGAKYIRYLVNGSSIGIKAALSAFRGSKVLYAAGVHRAFTEGCELFGVNAVCANGDGGGLTYNCGCEFLPEPITLKQAQIALNEHKDARALYITSPDYYGRTADIEIAELCRSRGVRLIADSAHGAHFAFSGELKSFGFERVADVCNMSAHKTLGALTQAALLAVNDGELINNIDRALTLLGTTSPNYAIMESLENSVLYALENGNEYARLKDFRKSLAGCEILENTDFTRICVRTRHSAEQVYFKAAKHGIMPEAVIGDYAVYIVTPYDGFEKLAKLKKALTEIT